MPDLTSRIIEHAATQLEGRVEAQSNRLPSRYEVEPVKTITEVPDDTSRKTLSDHSLQPAPGDTSTNLSSNRSDADQEASPEMINAERLVVNEETGIVLTPMSWEQLAPVGVVELSNYPRPDKEGLLILVAIKHVAVIGDEYELSDDGQSICDEFLEYQLNEWDDSALEVALQLIEARESGEVVAVSIGPEDAEQTLRKVLAKGAHRAVRVWDDSLVGADPITIGCAIASVAVLETPDLILTGVQSGDAANGATGASIAGILGIPAVSAVLDVEWNENGMMRVKRELEGGVFHNLESPYPAVLTIQTGSIKPRYATMRMIKQAKKKPLELVNGRPVGRDKSGAVSEGLSRPETNCATQIVGGASDVAKFVANLIRSEM